MKYELNQLHILAFIAYRIIKSRLKQQKPYPNSLKLFLERIEYIKTGMPGIDVGLFTSTMRDSRMSGEHRDELMERSKKNKGRKNRWAK